ncbi:MBL fold metallo-hydrolase [Thermomonospora umbrina]|uniref:Glyoxylase-like metal-dependent hydrolase (Beta-lactamase superfamily II) n=1 Tax=Thermomonospora umbrina TaxID=111806 RepID=A0A3D9T464_9ACTN|nr:MBL fold metallo-hydrolase [Thermomonospora umbrina]REF01164.1 glyoxylase-like metal-dependent hydrolase (beta-lactamase superfamily II) [Thermomonospora umbrina]
MSYTGDVQVGGRPDVRELPGLTVTKVAVGPYDNNAYLLRCAVTGEQLLVDAANEPARLLELIGDGPLGGVVTTHRHQDHWEALSPVVQATGAPVSAHPFDAESLPEPVTAPLEHGDRVRVGEAELEVIHLRGHTPGSIALLYDAGGRLADTPHLFTGDSLFPGGVGNTWGDPALFAQLLSDVEERVFARLPDATWFYPGHGKDSTLGKERPSLPEWRERGW